MSTPYLTQAEAAAYCRVCVTTFKKEVRPLIPCSYVGRKPVFHTEDLDAYMTEHKHFTVRKAKRGKGSAAALVQGNAAAARVLKELG